MINRLFVLIGRTFEMIKFEHTVFALPFAFLGAILAHRGLPPLDKSLWILVAMVGARSAAMSFNRLVDEPFDRQNPRTRNRALPTGLLSRRFVGSFVFVSSVVFLGAAAMLNRLSLILAFPALATVLLYSYAKRFTPLSHFVLGFALSIAPAGGWIAIQGTFDPKILLLALMVLSWVGGFDILYACQDIVVDSELGLFSIPVRVGIRKALWISFSLHLLTICTLLLLQHLFNLSWLALLGIVIVSAILIFEHVIIRPGDLSRINAAFFTMNGVFSILLFVFILADLSLMKVH